MPGCGTYEFQRFSSKRRKSELERLERQATVLLDQELAMLRRQGAVPGARLLELGCGPGFLTGALAALVGPGHVVALDRSPHLLDMARRRVLPEHSNVTIVEGDAQATGLPGRHFDLVYARMLLQHLPDPVEALREARRVTRPGGRVCVLDIDDGWLSLYPESKAFIDLTTRAVAARREAGGDRLVGRKLAPYMHAAGFRNVSVQVSSISSRELGMEAFLFLSAEFKLDLLPPHEARLLMEQIRSDVSGDQAVPPLGLLGIFTATGEV